MKGDSRQVTHRVSRGRRNPRVSNGKHRRVSLKTPMVEARISMKIPETFGLGTLLVDHPELVIEAIDRYAPDPHHVVVELQVRGVEEHDWSQEIRASPGVVSVRQPSRVGRPNVYRVRWRAPLVNTALLRRYDLIGAVPIVLSGGQASLSVALTKPRLNALVAQLRRRGLRPKILEVRPLRGRMTLGGLTPKQRVRFEAAVEAGFFDVPRRVTLDVLARRFSIRKSAFAESLALARRKILIAAGRMLVGGDESARSRLLGTP
jgi:predicted DNA binding protein